MSAFAKVKVPLLPQSVRSRSSLLPTPRSRSSRIQGQGPTAVITTEAEVKVQLPTPPLRSKFCCHQNQGPAAAFIAEAKVTTVSRVKFSVIDKAKVPLPPQSRRSRHQISSRSRLLPPSRSRPSCRQGQGPAFAVTTEAKVKTQQSTPPRKSKQPESSRPGSRLVSMPRRLLSRPCCHQSQGAAAAITSEAKVAATARGKPSADAKVTTTPAGEDPSGEPPVKDETPADDHTHADTTEAEGHIIPTKVKLSAAVSSRTRSSSLLSFLERELPKSSSLPPPKIPQVRPRPK